MAFVIIIFAAVGVGTAFYFLRNRKNPKSILPWIKWGYGVFRMTVDHWELQRKYKDETDLVARAFLLSTTVVLGKKDLRDTRKAVGHMLETVYNHYCPDKPLTETEKELMMSAYVTAISHKDLMETLASVSTGHEGLDVVRATTLCIDILGEAVHLEDALGQQYFQHLIYGINKALIVIRDQGTNPRALKKVASTLFRVYKITKAYRMRRRLSGMKAGEVYDKIIDLLEHVTYVVAVK
jgi:hypothetical protein